MTTDRSHAEVYFEHVAIGGYAKCSAIHAATGIEVSVTGPAGAMRSDMERLALRALERRLARGSTSA